MYRYARYFHSLELIFFCTDRADFETLKDSFFFSGNPSYYKLKHKLYTSFVGKRATMSQSSKLKQKLPLEKMLGESIDMNKVLKLYIPI